MKTAEDVVKELDWIGGEIGIGKHGLTGHERSVLVEAISAAQREAAEWMREEAEKAAEDWAKFWMLDRTLSQTGATVLAIRAIKLPGEAASHTGAQPEGIALHPDAALALCDEEAEKWETETNLAAFVARLASDHKSRGKLMAFAKQCFVEGAYRGACLAADPGSSPQNQKAAR